MNFNEKKHTNPIAFYLTQKSILHLKSNISEINNVNEWAQSINFSRGWLYNHTVEFYGKSPKIIIREIRYDELIKKIKLDFNISEFELSSELGLKDEVALSKFLRRHFDTSLKELKVKLIKQTSLNTTASCSKKKKIEHFGKRKYK